VTVHDVQDLTAVKACYRIPSQFQSCHTAIVDGYVIEGQVPLAEIKRLMAERPALSGIAVPGMPAGSPGMEVAGAIPQPFDVIAFDAFGSAGVFARYPR
jgi:hypothetical protein